MVEAWLPYGKTEVCCRLTEEQLGDLPKLETPPPLPDPATALHSALENPIQGNKLTDILGGNRKICLILDDHLGTQTICELADKLIEFIRRAAGEGCDLTVLQAHDTFHIFERSSKPRLSSDTYAPKLPEERKFATVGETSGGTKLDVCRAVAEAGIKLILTDVWPHAFSGFTGGGMPILPGVSSPESTKKTYGHAWSQNARRGILDGNPAYSDALEAAKIVGIDISINLLFNQRLQLVQIFAGDVEKAHRSAVDYYRKSFEAKFQDKSSILAASAGGYPFDRTFFNSVQVLDNFKEILRQDSAVILVSECTDGVGKPDFASFFVRHKKTEELQRETRKTPTGAAFTAHKISSLTDSLRVYLVSALPERYSNLFGMKPARTLGAAIQSASRILGRDARASVITSGMMLPFKATA